jgi:hypothetical protein
MKIRELKLKWEKEKVYYRNQEVGSGLHSFLKQCFESNELFSIKEGSLSTRPESRKNEYIHERKAKERHKFEKYLPTICQRTGFYFKKEKIFFDYFWAHLKQKGPKERFKRLKFLRSALEVIQNSRNSP